jgi:hypothetical protein
VSRLTSRRAALSVATLTALATLSGCGALHPGVEVQAGDDKITLQQIDDYSLDLCTVIQADASAGVYPMEAIRQGVVRSLALRSVATQLAEQYDVQPGGAYTTSVKGAERQLSAFTDTERERAVEVFTTPDYVQGVVNAIGTAELSAAGLDTSDQAAVSAKGEAILQAWTVEHGIEVDPRFGFQLSDNGLESVLTETSYALSDFAVQAGSDKPTAEFVAALPQSQRCG